MSLSPAELQVVRQMPLFASLGDDQLGCIQPGEVINLEPGVMLATEGTEATDFYVILEGEIRITRIYTNQEVLMARSKPGVFMGELSILLDIPWMASARTTKPTRIYRLGRDDFWRMLGACPTVGREIFRTAANRMRNVENYSMQRQKLESLGTMAAGLAHELNNPAAAARRAAAHLHETVDNVQSYMCSLSKGLTAAEWEDLLEASQEALARQATAAPLDPMTRSDREEALGTCLANEQIPDGWNLAPTLVAADLDAAWVGRLAAKLNRQIVPDAFGWLEAQLTLKSLLTQIEQSSGRIEELVKAVKSYSYMGKSPMQEVDIHEGLESTLTMLGHKLKNVEVVRCFDRSIPRLMAYGSELNQVWTNLLDNAIDAVKGNGRICISTAREDQQLVVEIVDNGSGIPVEIQSRLFEPFFTTKGVGSGTGLGLIISHRIIADRHGGEIEFESKPGETRFIVRLPLNREAALNHPDTASAGQGT